MCTNTNNAWNFMCTITNNARNFMCAITNNAWNFMCAITNNAWNFICTITKEYMPPFQFSTHPDITAVMSGWDRRNAVVLADE